MQGGIVWEYCLDEFVPTAFLTPLQVEFDSRGQVVRTWL
jgi:hypothetical protein